MFDCDNVYVIHLFFDSCCDSLYIVHLFCGCAAVVVKHTILRNKVSIVIVEPGQAVVLEMGIMLGNRPVMQCKIQRGT